MKISIKSFYELKKELGNVLERALKFFSIFGMVAYRTIGSPHFGGCCRFTPSCSEFALGCYHRFSFITATKLTFLRLISCRPGGKFGYDPVPEKGELNGPE